MIKKVFLLLLASLIIPTTNHANVPVPDSSYIQVELSLNIIDEGELNQSIHRTPPQAPVVFFDSESGMLCFCNPCYDTSLELVIPGSDTVVYECDIPDGSEAIELPTYLSGEYELRIIRGSWCFCGSIML